DIWLQDLPSNKTTRVTTSGQNLDPVWSRDGARVVFSARRDSDGSASVASAGVGATAFNLFARDLTPTLPSAMRLSDSTHNQFPCSISTAGIVYVDFAPEGDVTQGAAHRSASGASTGADLWMIPANGGPGRVLVSTPNDEGCGAFSDDGRWLA